MLSNFHTHSTFCDGKSTPEEIVQKAIEKGFSAIGFSGHGYTHFDFRYCMMDTAGYIAEIRRLKEKYKKDIQIYLGAEEDAQELVDRSEFDYIIGSFHYLYKDGNYYSIDSNVDYYRRCLAAFDNDIITMATAYYESFSRYIHSRKPDIIGHFDIITKFDEAGQFYLTKNEEYQTLSVRYAEDAAKSGCIIELYTGAVARGVRSTPFPSEVSLHAFKKAGARMILSSDSHHVDTLDFGFADAKLLLKDIGFKELYTLYNGEFVSYEI